jgi:cobalt/nickel transport system permease protein
MAITLTDIERETYKDSPIHRLDGRIKILITFAIIIYAVSLPRIHEHNLIRLSFLESYLIAVIILANLNPIYVVLRFIAILPFGLGVAIIQPFIRQSFIDSFTLYPISLPFGLTITYEGLEFGFTLLSKFIVCVTAIILLSSTTKMNEMVGSARRLGVPKEFTLLLTMMVRYLFLFWSIFKRIRTAQKTRLFHIRNTKVPHRWTLEQVGNSISSLFVRSYEQGERTYISMLCRGYQDAKDIFLNKSKLGTMDFMFLALTFVILISVHFFI